MTNTGESTRSGYKKQKLSVATDVLRQWDKGLHLS